jgi:hypothetical protein
MFKVFFGLRILTSSCADKTALNQAALFGILSDLDLVKVTQIGDKTITNTLRYSYGQSRGIVTNL